MATRICEYCYEYQATSSEMVAHYKSIHNESEGENE